MGFPKWVVEFRERYFWLECRTKSMDDRTVGVSASCCGVNLAGGLGGGLVSAFPQWHRNSFRHGTVDCGRLGNCLKYAISKASTSCCGVNLAGANVWAGRVQRRFRPGYAVLARLPWISMYTFTRLMAAGVTPGMRLACPSVAGRTRVSFSCISRDSPLTCV